jgi:hypothetical protein
MCSITVTRPPDPDPGLDVLMGKRIPDPDGLLIRVNSRYLVGACRDRNGGEIHLVNYLMETVTSFRR